MPSEIIILLSSRFIFCNLVPAGKRPDLAMLKTFPSDYCRETGKGHDITKEEALEILQRAEENGFVHQCQ